ncbi:MAG: cytochrome c [Motiliproteus sp.]|nr:cytochrome c [Motiliproteus sp.]
MNIGKDYLIPLFSVMLLIPSFANAQNDPDRVSRGEYVFHLSGCASCHTDSKNGGEPLAGGLKMETPFGIFYTPNISSDSQYGIGGWSEEDFIRAMTEGNSPAGDHYYPAFPYASYSQMSKEDLIDLKTYLDTQPAVAVPSKTHDLSFPFNQRLLLGFWKFFNFSQEPLKQQENRSNSWNRGAYIVNGPGHCVECHTPRNLMGGLDSDAGMVGNDNGPEGEAVPGLLATPQSDFSSWGVEDIVFSLETGMKPDGDFIGGSMGHVIDNTTSKLTPEDLKAIAEYLKNP